MVAMPKVHTCTTCGHGISIFLLLLASFSTHAEVAGETVTIRMPGVRPRRPDTYQCTSVKLPVGTRYIVHFEPKASQKVAHHMILFGCNKPGSDTSSWNCGSMSDYRECDGGERVIFAWAKDAPSKDLPKDVGFEVGGSTKIHYLVLQVHYAQAVSSEDRSGFLVHTTRIRQPFNAGIYLLWAGFAKIPPKTNGIHVNIACEFKEKNSIFAFAYRTHAHKLARVITGYRIRNGEWTLLGKGDPQAPQAFYPMEKVFEIKPGDILASRCTYDAVGHHLTHTVRIGSTASDEMCNFYIMFYTDSSHELRKQACSDQRQPDIFADFPPDSDTPLEESVPRGAEASEAHTPSITPDVIRGNITKGTTGENGRPETPESDRKVNLPEESLGSNVRDWLSVDRVDHQEGSITPTSTTVFGLKKTSTFRVVKDWPRLSDADLLELGQISGVAMDSKGRIVIFHRGNRDWGDNTFTEYDVLSGADRVGPITQHTVWIIHPDTGKVIAKWGKSMFYLPHGLTIDHEDNVWLTDVGSHQVFKFSPLAKFTKQLLELGESLVPGSDDVHFCKPTDVAVERSGDFFVADGYCNSRIMKFSAEGKLLGKWGQRSHVSMDGGLPLAGTFRIPHSVTLDEQSGILFVADRENGRIQSFNSTNGEFLTEVFLPEFGGRVYAVNYNKVGGVIHVVNGPSMGQRLRSTPVSGLTIRAADGALLHTWPAGKQVFQEPHALVSSPDNMDVYVTEIEPNRVWKLTKHAVASIIPARPANQTPTREQVPSYTLKPTSSNGNYTAPRNQDTPANHTTWSHPIVSPGNMTSDSRDGEEEEDIVPPGVVPAMIILSVLAVPIIFLLLVSIVIRIRAYHRDKRDHLNRYHGNNKSLGVSHSRGWLSYMNCCDRRKYSFNRVTLQDYYSDSESDGV